MHPCRLPLFKLPLMFIAVLFTIVKKLLLPKHASSNEWKMETWYICTREFCSTVKKNEIHRKRDGIGECSSKEGLQAQEDKSFMFFLIFGS